MKESSGSSSSSKPSPWANVQEQDIKVNLSENKQSDVDTGTLSGNKRKTIIREVPESSQANHDSGKKTRLNPVETSELRGKRSAPPIAEEDAQASIYRRIQVIGIRNRTFSVSAEVSEEQEFPALSEPLLTKAMLRTYPEVQLRNGMKREMDQMLQFGAYESIHIDSVPAGSEILDFTWVHKVKGDEIRSRLCVRGFG